MKVWTLVEEFKSDPAKNYPGSSNDSFFLWNMRKHRRPTVVSSTRDFPFKSRKFKRERERERERERRDCCNHQKGVSGGSHDCMEFRADLSVLGLFQIKALSVTANGQQCRSLYQQLF